MKNIVFFIIFVLNFSNLISDYHSYLLTDLKNINHSSDVIVISDIKYFSTLDKYLKYRSTDFPSICLVDVEDIYSQFKNDKASSIRDFLFYTKNNWKGNKNRNILLVGWFDQIPNLRLRKDYLSFDSLGKDTYFVLDTLNKIDTLIYNIARFPVRSISDLEILINKTIKFEENSVFNKYDAAILYDSVDSEGFEYRSEYINNKFESQKIFRVSGDPNSKYFNSFDNWLNQINQGSTLLMGYIHGNPCTWGFNKFLTCDKYINTKFNNNPFVFLAISCSQSSRNIDKKGILELLLTKDENGAVATIASETLALLTPGLEIAYNFISKKIENENLRLGDLWRFSLNSGERDPLKFNYTLLGDPLLKIKPIYSDVNFSDNDLNNFISPNPASEYIFVNSVIQSEAKNPEIEIFNIFGEKESTPSLLRNATPQEGNLKIDISKFQAGVYFIKIGDKFEKFVKL